jgi:hypothetical protein
MDAETELVAAADPWALALPVLAGPHVEAVPELVALVADLRGAGARLFEVVVGTPIGAYGARLTFRTGIRDAADVAARVGLADHPWGVPDWVGLRTGADGAVRAKAYHRRTPLDATLLHRGLPDSARPVMAARVGRSIEVYAVLPGAMGWQRHATAALEPLGCAPVAPGLSLVARPNGWAVSVRHDGDELSAVTLFATSETLPADGVVEEQWVSGMSVEERQLHGLRVAAAATVSRTPGRRYRMLAWNYTRSGLFSRAVSLHSGDVLVDG